MKDSLILAISAIKYFHSLRDENDKPIYLYNDEYLRYFVRKSIKGGRFEVLIQYYKSPFSDEVFDIFWKELKDSVNICDILDENFDYENKHKKIFQKEYKSQFEEYRHIKPGEKAKCINNKLGKLLFQE